METFTNMKHLKAKVHVKRKGIIKFELIILKFDGSANKIA